MRHSVLVAILFICTLAESCLAFTIRSTSAGELKSFGSSQTASLQANTETSVTLTEPALFTSPNHVPVLLVPVCPLAVQRIELAAPSVEDTLSVRDSNKKLSEGMAAFADGYGDFETALSAKNLNEAETKLNQLVARFPELPFFYLPMASLAYLRGHRNEARSLIEKYLEFKPGDSHALKLLQSLKGGGV